MTNRTGMELAHSLLLNEEALARIQDAKRSVFVFEWLRFLDKVLVAAQKSDIKESQKKLISQLTNQISESPGPPTRKLIARCLSTLFSVGDTFDLFETIGTCNNIIKTKDDSPSYLPTRLCAIACLGAMYETLGRMVGRSYEETIQILIKALKNAESQGRCEIMLTLEKVVYGLGSAGISCHKDIYKAARQAMTDRAMSVRFAAAKCMMQLVNEAQFVYTSELETMTSLCFRALDGSNYDVRCSVAQLLGRLLVAAQSPKTAHGKGKQYKSEDVLALLASGFLRGGLGFLKTSGSSSNSINREVRVGITHAYVEFIKCMGGPWLERNISVFLHHVLDLVASNKTTPSHVESVYARKCVLFILRSSIGGLLGEKAQISAAKEICQIIIKEMNSVGEAVADNNDKSGDSNSPHILVCALNELGSLVLRLGTSASPLVSEPMSDILDPVISVLIHPSSAARLSASWCLGSISVALPSQLTPLLNRCMDRMEKLKASPEAVSGYSSAMASLMGGVYQCQLGIPHAKGKQIFSIAEELLRTASQNSRLSLQRTQSGWLLFGAHMTLGSPVVKSHLPRMLLLWRNAFPRSTKELESEKVRGDSFTWQVTLEGRAGALAAMQSFLLHCRELVTEDVIRRLLATLECALSMLSHLPSVMKLYGSHLKASVAMIRLRLYDVLSLLPAKSFEHTYPSLLRELVAEFTLTDNSAHTTTSLLRSMCHVDDSVILGSWLQETDHKAIEDQLQPNSASGSGALEHDPAYLYARCPPSDPLPGPLPLGVAVIDSSVKLYGTVFPLVAQKHRYQMLQHFNECIKQAKSSRQQAVQINIFTAVLCALKNLSETKAPLGPDDVRKAAFTLIMGALGSSNPILRCAAGEALGRMAQVVGDSRFIAEMAQHSFDRLKSARDVVSRTGHSLALGCLHRYVGGLGSGQHLNTSISILLALAQDFNSPVVQVWALHALALIADSGGPMFRTYVEPTLSLVLQLLLTVPPATVDVHQCLGKCLSALITSLGPELQLNTSAKATARLYCLVCCAIMQDHSDSLVQAEAIACLQQLHMFAPRHVNLTTLVPHLCEILTSSHLLLRRAAVACLRQLATREAREVIEHALVLANENKENKELSHIMEGGLEGALFRMLDTEIDGKLISDLQDTLVSLLQSLATENLTRWLILLKDVLSASTDLTTSMIQGGGGRGRGGVDDAGDKDEEDEDVDVTFKASEADNTHPSVAPRWPTRVFAIECLQKIITACEVDDAHFELATAKELKASTGRGDYLVLHLSELVRMAFIAATSDSNQLRLAGLAALQAVISKFARVPEPEFPGHVILEQYQAQVGAALRPAFSPDTPSDVTATACEVCSAWIGSGVARDLNDLRRVHQLLVSSLAKLKVGKSQCQLYNESASTMEKLAVLKAWAEVYIVSIDREKEKLAHPPKTQTVEDYEYSGPTESLLSLVQPELSTLIFHWLAALKDHALLSLPSEYSSQLPSEGGTFYQTETIESARPHYRSSWPSILHAVCIWLNETGFTDNDGKHDIRRSSGEKIGPSTIAPANMNPEQVNADRVYLILGICLESLCSPTSKLPEQTVDTCLKALSTLLSSAWARRLLGGEQVLSREILNVMHRLLLTRENTSTHLLVLDVVKFVIRSAQDRLDSIKDGGETDVKSDEDDAVKIDITSLSKYGEGGQKGHLNYDESVVYATLEVVLCVLIRKIPAINPAAPSTGFQLPMRLAYLTDDSRKLVAGVVQIMGELPSLCTCAGALAILPTILHLTTSVLREMGAKSSECRLTVNACILVLKTMCESPHAQEPDVRVKWMTLLQSALATVLHYAKPGADKSQLGEGPLLMTLTMLLSWCPLEATGHQKLVNSCIEHYQKAWMSTSVELQLLCVQGFISILQHSDPGIYTPFIHALAPKIIDHLYSLNTYRPSTESGLTISFDAINMMETLVSVADDDKRISLLALLVPILISLLLEDSSLQSADTISKQLHDHAIQRLTKIGPQYPVHFRTIISTAPEIKLRLEGAIRANQAKAVLAKAQQLNKVSPESSKPPSIALKTDFSNFAA